MLAMNFRFLSYNVLSKNSEDLTWRDVQHVIVQSSRPDKSALKTSDWKINGAGLMGKCTMDN